MGRERYERLVARLRSANDVVEVVVVGVVFACPSQALQVIIDLDDATAECIGMTSADSPDQVDGLGAVAPMVARAYDTTSRTSAGTTPVWRNYAPYKSRCSATDAWRGWSGRTTVLAI